MGTRGLLSRLGSAEPARPLDDVESILGNLRAILNTRLGESLSAQGYGIVDLVELVHDFPSGAQEVQRSIRATVMEYEPRLRGVRVRILPSDDPLKLVFELSARLAGSERRDLVRVRTEVRANGQAIVE